ncbi:Vitamin B12-binding protein [bacterium HR15]|nr:Vitamin B12-binding protein [bacterium HR15]
MKGARRIVSLAPSITEILFALKLGERVVGVTALCNYPPEARSKPKVGDANINPERVVALKPDLVVAHELLNGRVIPVLRRLGLRVLSANPNTFEKLFAFIRQIGEAAGVPERAEQLVRQMQARMKRVQQRVARTRSRPRVLFIIGVEPLWASGQGTFADDLIRRAGGVNALGSQVRGFRAISLETALAAHPEVMILAGPNRAAILNDPRWRNTPAVQRGHVYEVNPDIYLRESPRLIDALEQLASLLHSSDSSASSGVISCPLKVRLMASTSASPSKMG